MFALTRPVLPADTVYHANVLVRHSRLTQGKMPAQLRLGGKVTWDLYSDLSVALSKESGGTQLAPPDPIFYTQAVKNNPSIQCLATKDIFKLAEYFPCGS